MRADLAYGHGTDNPADDAWYLVLATLGISFDCDELELQKELGSQDLAILESRVQQRIEKKIPVAYLVGEAWFAGNKFKIDQRALIPRSPIAELINSEFQPMLKTAPARILDLCTGSGCIGISCALQLAAALVDLADISRDALSLAQENIELHGLGKRVQIIESDLFSNISHCYGLIVCNPPYVPRDEIVGLPEEFLHEPETGLFSEDNGLKIPLQILQQAADYLQEDGLLIMEVGHSHHELSARLPKVPFMWLEFDQGGEGVFVLSRSELLKYRDCFN